MNILELLVTEEIPIRMGIEQLDRTAKKILLVVKDEKLIGIVTDGDIRRWILKNGDLSQSIRNVMNTAPITLREDQVNEAELLMKKKNIEAIPLVDRENRVIDVLFWHQLKSIQASPNELFEAPVIIMAGGMGSRLYPYTKIIPKPLIPIGDIPIVERIMDEFYHYGFRRFYLTINYKKDLIKAYFNKEVPYQLYFVEEPYVLGTIGSLGLIKNQLTQPFFVSNCDIIVKANYSHILKYHQENKHKITIVTALKNYTIPYGVVRLNENECVSVITEKPSFEFLVNTGMYILEPDVLDYIPEGKAFDMPELISQCLENGERVGAYPVTQGAWLDMGEFKEMQNMMERLR